MQEVLCCVESLLHFPKCHVILTSCQQPDGLTQWTTCNYTHHVLFLLQTLRLFLTSGIVGVVHTVVMSSFATRDIPDFVKTAMAETMKKTPSSVHALQYRID